FEIENGARPAVVNRLDRDTSGLVVIAKHTRAARELGIAFERRMVAKEYTAIVCGWPETDQWQCDAPILRAGELGTSRIWVRQMVHPTGRHCRTRFEVIRRFERGECRFSVVRCHPETGRMHQIRVHLAHAGHPIVGDKIYSGDGSSYLEWMETGWTERLAEHLLLRRHALHADRLEIDFGERRVQWSIGLPPELSAFVDGAGTADLPAVVIWRRNG
ncbi:MAG: RNA pseudouridine synthase, partial [Verrucomicrobiae bacterium]|nr:RNA pseudouridine synthase [Verrucomicrobiae bacterium]